MTNPWAGNIFAAGNIGGAGLACVV
jgi:hypothetical protein